MKMKFNTSFVSVLILVVTFISSCNTSTREVDSKGIIGEFELLSSEQTGVDFNNTIKETSSFNHFYFGHIYNGSGVAIGDINNDGLQDIFFAGNQVTDRLFLNK
jgi:hypothetical protein